MCTTVNIQLYDTQARGQGRGIDLSSVTTGSYPTLNFSFYQVFMTFTEATIDALSANPSKDRAKHLYVNPSRYDGTIVKIGIWIFLSSWKCSKFRPSSGWTQFGCLDHQKAFLRELTFEQLHFDKTECKARWNMEVYWPWRVSNISGASIAALLIIC